MARLLSLASSLLRSQAWPTPGNGPFAPPSCPGCDRDSHFRDGAFRDLRTGRYRRETPPHRVRPFRCRTRRVHSWRRTFETTCSLRLPDLLEPVFRTLLGCSSLPRVARDPRVAHATIARSGARLGRLALHLHETRRPGELPDEALVLDGFRSFERGRLHRRDFSLLVGADSRFLHALAEAELPCSGSMRPEPVRQRARLEELFGRPDPKATESSVAELLRHVVPERGSTLLVADEQRAEPRALTRLPDRGSRQVRISSRRARRPDGPFDPVNDADRFGHHGQGKHERETIAFSKRRPTALERPWCLLTCKNHGKGVDEAKRTETPAHRLEIFAGRSRWPSCRGRARARCARGRARS